MEGEVGRVNPRTKTVTGYVFFSLGLLGLIPALFCVATGRARPDWARTLRDCAYPLVIVAPALILAGRKAKPKA